MLRKELHIFTFKDLLEHFPHRHIDKTHVDTITSLNHNTEYAQVAGILLDFEILGAQRSKRLVAHVKDQTGIIELVWFQGAKWMAEKLKSNTEYIVYGKVQRSEISSNE